MLETKGKKFAVGACSLLVAAFVLSFIGACDRNQAAMTSVPIANQSRAAVPEEKFCGADVCPMQILVKLEGCPSVDRMPAFTAELQKLFQQQTRDGRAEVSQVGSGCLFLAQSSKLSVRELIQVVSYLKTNQANQTLLAPFGLNDVTFDYAEPNFKIKFDANQETTSPLPNDERFISNEQWGLGSLVPGIDADVVRAWRFATGSKEIVVGVLDTGLAIDHEDLKANTWCAPEDFNIRIAGETIVCSKGSHGYNVLGATKAAKCNPDDDAGHGTMVTGIIGARGNNKIGIVGVNWETSLLALRIGDGSGTCVSNAINGIDFAIQLKRRFPKQANIRVLNASWGYISSPECEGSMKSLKGKIAEAGTYDILVVGSAGNGGNDNDKNNHYPSGFDLQNVISVTAISKNGGLYHSNQGKTTVHLGAPGEGILSTFPPPRNYDYGGFTSMAAPYVSGAAALMLSTPGCTNLHAPDIKRLILQGAVATRGLSVTATGGRLSIYNSIEACKKKP